MINKNVSMNCKETVSSKSKLNTISDIDSNIHQSEKQDLTDEKTLSTPFHIIIKFITCSK